MTGTNRLWALELLRGLAAVAVVLCHVYLQFPELSRSEMERAVSNWGVTAVVVFFVLSGAVIRLSVERSSFAPGEFLWRRFVRIVPLYLLAVAAGVLMDTQPVSTAKVIGHLTFTATLPGWIVPTFESNPVLWSLSYEMGFYLLFAAFRGTDRKGELVGLAVAALGGIAVCLGGQWPGWLEQIKNVVAFYGVWLVGYYAIKFRARLTTGMVPACFMAACIPMLARSFITEGYPDYGQSLLIAGVLVPWLACQVNGASGVQARSNGGMLATVVYLACVGVFLFRSQSRLQTSIIYATFPLVALAVCWTFRNVQFAERVRCFAGWLGLVSYALYLFHYPVLFGASRLFGPANRVAAVGAVIGVFVLAHLLETHFQTFASRMLAALHPRARRQAPSP